MTVIDGIVSDLVEVKLSDTNISSNLKYYAKKLELKRAVQIVGSCSRAFEQDGVSVMNPAEFFQDPPWVTNNKPHQESQV